MSPKRIPLRQRLYNQTPRYITFGGYVLGLGILGGAVSTRFVPTDVSAQGTATIRVPVASASLPQQAVLLERLRPAGALVTQGEPVAVLASDPEAVASYITRYHSRKALEELAGVPGAGAQLRAALEDLAVKAGAGGSTTTVSAPRGGYVIGGAAQSGAEPILAPSTPVVEIANLDKSLTIEVDVPSEQAPTIGVGEGLRVLLSDLSPVEIAAVVKQVDTTATVEVLKSAIRSDALAELRERGSGEVEALGVKVPVVVAPAAEGISLSFSTKKVPPAELDAARATQSTTLKQVGAAREAVEGKLSQFRSRVTLSVDGPSLTPALRQAVGERLAAGSAAIPGGSCWVKVSSRPLFNRLFGK